VFALVAFLVVGACTAWDLVDGDAVDVSCGAGHVDRLLGNIVGATSGAVDYEHPIAMIRPCLGIAGLPSYLCVVARCSFSR